MDRRPIGIFDSGFGGLTVARALIDLCPAEDVVYVGDTARYPYGPRPATEVRRFAAEITRYLLEREGVKLVVVACNTAASVALDDLRRLAAPAGVPVVGVIEPGLRAAERVSTSGRVGVIGTVGTIASGSYPATAQRLGLAVELACLACPGFVEFVERGETESDQVHVLAERLLSPLRAADIDTLLLGCTHYPFLARTIGDVMGREVVLVSSADETAFEVRDLLASTGLAAPQGGAAGDGSEAVAEMAAPTAPTAPTASEPASASASASGEPAPARRGSVRFLSSGDLDTFTRLGRKLLGPELESAERLDLAGC